MKKLIIVLNVTVFTVLSSGVVQFEGSEPTMKGIKLVQEAFSQHLFGSTFGYLFIAVCLLFFAFSTIIGWYYFGETNIRYLSLNLIFPPHNLLSP